MGKSTCSVEGCEKPLRAKGLCGTHYRRMRLFGSLERPVKGYDSPCSTDGCERPAASHGMCQKHCARWLRHGDPHAGRAANGLRQAWLTEHLARPSWPDECVLWPFPLLESGYGVIHLADGKTHRAHRVVCEAVHGAPPAPMLYACHRCNVRACVNPGHLYWGTPKQNSHDMIAAGTLMIGEANPLARLTEADVLAIRRHSAEGVAWRALAAEYNCSLPNIEAVVNRRTWKHLP